MAIRTTTTTPSAGGAAWSRLRAPAAGLLALGLLAGCGSDDASTDATATGSVSAEPSGGQGGGPGGGIDGNCEASGASPSAAPSTAVPSNADTQEVSNAVTATQAFLDTLDSTDGVVFDHTDLDGKRCSWSNFPDGLFDGRQGARLGDLTEEQRTAAMTAVQSVMAAAGYTYVQEMMAGDDTLAGDGSGPVANASFGSDNYHLALYGQPSTDSSWTLQFGGHHLAVHVSVGGDTLSVSPYFKGTQPVSYEANGSTVEPMGGTADQVFGVFESLPEDQLSAAELSGSYDDLVMGPGNDTGFPESEGLAYGDLDSATQKLVRGAIEAYVADYAPELSQPLVDLYESQLDQTVVAWSGSIDRDSNAYLRIDGPRVWIEWVNTDNPGASGIHYHTVYRDKLLDYGTGTGQ